MRRLAALALLGLLLAASGSLAAPAPDAPTVGAGPANISITIGQTKAFTIARGPPTIFIVDLTTVTNSTFLEVFFQSPQGSKSQCTFTYTVNGQIFTGSFPNVFQLYNYYLRLGQSNNTIIVNETMGLCAASLTVRLSPLIALVPKAGLQAVNVQILVNSYVRFTIGSPGEAIAPFALNITGTNAQMSLSGPGNCGFYQPVTGAVPTCVLDANRIPFGQYGGNGLGWTGPWNLTLTLSSSFYPLQFQFINVTYVPEPALPLAIAVQQNISLSSFYSNIFTVPLSRTQGRNITVTALNCMAGFAYSAGNFAIVGSASIGWNYNTYSFSFLLPPSRTATSWVTVIERTDMGSVPCPGTIIVT